MIRYGDFTLLHLERLSSKLLQASAHASTSEGCCDRSIHGRYSVRLLT